MIVEKYIMIAREVDAIQWDGTIEGYDNICKYLKLNKGNGGAKLEIFPSCMSDRHHICLTHPKRYYEHLIARKGDWICQDSSGTFLIVPNFTFKKYYHLK